MNLRGMDKAKILFKKLRPRIPSISLSLGGVRSSCNIISRILNPAGLKERGTKGAKRKRERKSTFLHPLW